MIQGNGDVITIAGSGTIRIYVDGQINLQNLVFAPGSTATVQIVQNSYNVTNANRTNLGGSTTSIGDPNNPRRMILMSNYTGGSSVSTGGEMQLNGGAMFSGIVYAPYAGMALNGTADFYGSITAGNYSGTVNGSFNFHYDESLATVSFPFSTPRLTAAAWMPWPVSANQP
jgi:hypothetical protein